jgi:hypothetical protein
VQRHRTSVLFLLDMPPRDRQGRRHLAVPKTVVPTQT